MRLVNSRAEPIRELVWPALGNNPINPTSLDANNLGMMIWISILIAGAVIALAIRKS